MSPSCAAARRSTWMAPRGRRSSLSCCSTKHMVSNSAPGFRPRRRRSRNAGFGNDSVRHRRSSTFGGTSRASSVSAASTRARIGSLLEETADVLDAPSGEHRRQALQELLPVALLRDALVEDDGDADVRLAADEATDTLAQRDDGERHEVAVEGARIALADGVDDRIVGRRKRQLVDDEPGERLARDVDARPE